MIVLSKLFAILIITAFSTVAVAHEGEEHKEKNGSVKLEQKEWGIAGDVKRISRTVVLTMSDDMRFRPDSISVRQGEVIRFVVKNTGKMLHEIVIGTKQELDAHAALMIKFPMMEHEEPYMAHVKPSTQEDLVWNFNKPGEFDFACLIAGHYQAGMVGKVKVRSFAGDKRS